MKTVTDNAMQISGFVTQTVLSVEEGDSPISLHSCNQFKYTPAKQE